MVQDSIRVNNGQTKAARITSRRFPELKKQRNYFE
jgi:hypothetical protein